MSDTPILKRLRKLERKLERLTAILSIPDEPIEQLSQETAPRGSRKTQFNVLALCLLVEAHPGRALRRAYERAVRDWQSKSRAARRRERA